jgi:hypothetical protein
MGQQEECLPKCQLDTYLTRYHNDKSDYPFLTNLEVSYVHIHPELELSYMYSQAWSCHRRVIIERVYVASANELDCKEGLLISTFNKLIALSCSDDKVNRTVDKCV